MQTSIPLAMAAEGAIVRVVEFRGGVGMVKKVTEMGLNIGVEIHIRQRESSGLVISRGETRYAIGGGMALKIMVLPSMNKLSESDE